MTFNSDIQRLGFCCKYLHQDQTLPKRVLTEHQQPLNTRGTTVAWCNRQQRDVAERRLLEVAEHNAQSVRRLVAYVGSLPANRRMVRLGSDLIPMATQHDWRYLWEDDNNRLWLSDLYGEVGDLARDQDVRLSFHPGQFCCIVSDRPDVVDRSIDELEYHADVARWMGYGQQFQDFKCNIHLSGKLGAEAFPHAYSRMSETLRNILTIENDEFGAGLEDVLPVAEYVPIVLDVHHHFIRDHEYITPSDDRFKRVIDSWRGQRPAIHYSYSRDEHLPQTPDVHDGFHDMDQLLEDGHKKTKLRAHSDFYPNDTVNDWALSFWPYADIQCESKMKNLAQAQLYEHAQRRGLV